MNNERKYDTCEIVGDLLPLYVDGICSEASKAMVEDHAKECERCLASLEGMRSADAERILQAEKSSALERHKRRLDYRIFKSILCATSAAYVPLLFIAPLFATDTGLAPTNYPFKLLVVLLYTLPFLTSLISLGFTVSKRVCRVSLTRADIYIDRIGAVASLITLVACLDLDGLLYLALLGSAINLVIWVACAIRGRRRNEGREIQKKIFGFCFFLVFTAFLAIIIAFTSVVGHNGKRPERDDQGGGYSDPYRAW